MRTYITGILKILLPAFVMLSAACEKNPVDDNGLRVEKEVYSGAIIVNEGHFQQGDASLSFYDNDNKNIYNDVFAAENGEALGDVGNSIYIRDSLAYIVVNNSDKIEVINTSTFRRRQVITLPPGTSPRHLAFSDQNNLFVTSLYGGKVLIIDSGSGKVAGEITVAANPEELLRINDRIFVANSGFGAGNTISVIDLNTNQVLTGITVGDNPRFLRQDPYGRVHALCSGAFNDWADPNDDTPGGVWVIDPSGLNVMDTLLMPAGQHPGKFDISAGGTGYVVMENTIMSYDAETMEILSADLIPGMAIQIYGLRYNNYENLLYILDAVDYVSAGKLWIFDPADLTMDGPYTTGAIPGDLGFLVDLANE